MKRRIYKPGERDATAARLECRAPAILRAHLDSMAVALGNGYRTKTEMYSRGLAGFLSARPWEDSAGQSALAWRSSGAVGNGTVISAIFLEPVEIDGAEVSGAELLALAREQATLAGVSLSTFGTTCLWWIALEKHPPSDKAVLASLLSDAPEDAVTPVPGRVTYSPGARRELTARLGTRAPSLLRDYLRSVAERPGVGQTAFSSMSHLLTIGVHGFLAERPWDPEIHGRQAFPWRGGRADGTEGQVVVPIALLSITPPNSELVTGPELLARVHAAAREAGVSASTFALTCLWWLALTVFPPQNEEESALVRSLPTNEPDKRFRRPRAPGAKTIKATS